MVWSTTRSIVLGLHPWLLPTLKEIAASLLKIRSMRLSSSSRLLALFGWFGILLQGNFLHWHPTSEPTET